MKQAVQVGLKFPASKMQPFFSFLYNSMDPFLDDCWNPQLPRNLLHPSIKLAWCNMILGVKAVATSAWVTFVHGGGGRNSDLNCLERWNWVPRKVMEGKANGRNCVRRPDVGAKYLIGKWIRPWGWAIMVVTCSICCIIFKTPHSTRALSDGLRNRWSVRVDPTFENLVQSKECVLFIYIPLCYI